MHGDECFYSLSHKGELFRYHVHRSRSPAAFPVQLTFICARNDKREGLSKGIHGWRSLFKCHASCNHAEDRNPATPYGVPLNNSHGFSNQAQQTLGYVMVDLVVGPIRSSIRNHLPHPTRQNVAPSPPSTINAQRPFTTRRLLP